MSIVVASFVGIAGEIVLLYRDSFDVSWGWLSATEAGFACD